ncbi:hypothetical protein [Azospirillum oleiclasticum]|uniref:hypothetical protein n=1 Tax=Azospirillum oleiclasticum TaxID=2735135 RepID=UPI0015D4EA92|nr:hypothetical protein [Azospirillum oleiclasticum]
MTRRNRLPILFAAALLVLPVAGRAASSDQNRELQACATIAELKPEEGLESARAWMQRGGGDPARLCEALALFHKGDFPAAGKRLEDLAGALGGNDPRAEAQILARAGWAWLRAGDAARADRLYSRALERQPGDLDLFIDRAFARAEAERYWDAVADLDLVIARAPDRADAWLYRAAAHKALSNLHQAAADVGRALELRPNDPEAVLLRGNIKAAAGDVRGAAEDWRAVTRTAPDSTQARAARVNLDRLGAMPPAPQPARGQPPAKPPAATPPKAPAQ